MSFYTRTSINYYHCRLGILVFVLAFPMWDRTASSQPAQTAESLFGDQTEVTLNLTSKLSLEAFLSQMTAYLNVRYQYTSDIASRKISIQTPAKVPRAALPYLLSSVLKSEGLAIVDGDINGWKRIILAADMPKHSDIVPAGEADNIFRKDGAGAPATQLFILKKLQASQVVTLLQGFSMTAKSLIIPGSNNLIITDYANNVTKIAGLIELLDKLAGESVFEFYEVKNQSSTDLTKTVQEILSGKKTEAAADATADPKSVRLVDDPKGNRIVIAGQKELVEQAKELLQRFDVEQGFDMKLYTPKNLTAVRLDKIIKGYLPEQEINRAYQGTVDEEGNLLIVRATAKIHNQIKLLLSDLDKAPTPADSPIRIIKLKNARAENVLSSLMSLQDAYGTGFTATQGQFFNGAFGTGIPGYGGLGNGLGLLGLGNGLGGFGNGLGGQGGGMQGGLGGGVGQFGNQGFQNQQLPLQPGQNNATGVGGGIGGASGGGSRTGRLSQNQNQTQNQGQRGQGGNSNGGFGLGGSATLPGGVHIAADQETNSLIVVGPASVQPIYEKLIQQLDQRRPQVMIEVKLIAIDTTDGFTFGVEASGGDRDGAIRAFQFTSFGLSTVNPTTGALTPLGGRGYNGTILDAKAADVIVRALATHTRSRVLAEPKIMVNDNDTGILESVVEIPFASVNASNTVSTTSVGGSKTAGTTITLTPQINEDDNLHLEFEIEFSSFSGSGTATLPPATNRQTVGSKITIPDGQTVVVGGLKRVGARQEYAGIPWIEKIPIVRDLLGRTDESKESTAFFVFIRPIILRDSRFEDLQYISDRQSGMLGIPSEYPNSQPVLMGSDANCVPVARMFR